MFYDIALNLNISDHIHANTTNVYNIMNYKMEISKILIFATGKPQHNLNFLLQISIKTFHAKNIPSSHIFYVPLCTQMQER